MIPLKDRNPTRRVPYITFGLIAINILLFLYELSLGDSIAAFLDSYGIVPVRISTFFSGGQISITVLGTVLSSMFLHGGWLHLGGNMLYLWIFGDNVEDKLGHSRFVVFYLLCGLASAFLHIFVDPSSSIPTIGASGAIAGILGGYIILFPKARIVTLIPIFVFLHVTELPAIVVLGFWFVLQFFNGVLAVGGSTVDAGGIAWWAHIGGFAAGVALVIPFRRYR